MRKVTFHSILLKSDTLCCILYQSNLQTYFADVYSQNSRNAYKTTVYAVPCKYRCKRRDEVWFHFSHMWWCVGFFCVGFFFFLNHLALVASYKGLLPRVAHPGFDCLWINLFLSLCSCLTNSVPIYELYLKKTKSKQEPYWNKYLVWQ